MAHAFGFEPDIRAQTRTDELIADLAMRQHGVVSRSQLIARGIGRREIGHRIERQRLHVVQRGVYAVGHAVLTREGRWMSAVLAAGGVLSHRAAAAAWEIHSSQLLEVTASRPRQRPGMRIHYALLPEDEIDRIEGIPVTGVSRTLFDLASVLRLSQLERAVNEVEVRGLTDSLSLPDLLDRYPRRHGTPLLRAVLDGHRGVSHEGLEEHFFAWAKSVGLPTPERNAYVFANGRWFECDCVWRARRLIVELDSRRFHATAAAFEHDRARDRALGVAGWRAVRVTWRQLYGEPESLAADLRALLSR